jgi:aminopeptidase N
VTVPGCGAVVINAGQSTYARVRYTEAGLATLRDAFGRLGVDDQLGLLADTQALALAGRLPMAQLLALMRGVPASRDNPMVAHMLVDQLQDLDQLHDGLASRPAFREWARALLAPFLREVGSDARDGEGSDVRTLRVALVQALGVFGDAEVLAGVRKSFEGWLADPDSLDADRREAVLYVVAARADAATWDKLHALALAAPTELEKGVRYQLLGEARDPALAQRALALAISGEPPATVASRLLRAIAWNHPDLALAFIADHWAKVEPLFGEGAGATIAARFFDTGADAALLPRLDAFVRAHVPAAARDGLVKTAAVIRYRATVRTQRVPEADRWIAAQVSAATF